MIRIAFLILTVLTPTVHTMSILASAEAFTIVLKLASMETQIALNAFVRRHVNPRLVTDPPPYRELATLRGPQHLAVTFDDLRD
jgi:hypothetical protein